METDLPFLTAYEVPVMFSEEKNLTMRKRLFLWKLVFVAK
jgi:hypothetical protein